MVRIVCISDTHNQLHKVIPHLPAGDVLIHAGDLTSVGAPAETAIAVEMLSKLPYQKVLFIAGNHDMGFEHSPELMRGFVEYYSELSGGRIEYLEETSVTVFGYKFYGFPHTPKFGNWGFMTNEEQMDRLCRDIPEDTDVLITHGPPLNILDVPGEPYKYDAYGELKHCGSDVIRRHVLERVKPQLCVFGHIHGSYGETIVNSTRFVNASILGEDYRVTNPPVVVDL